MIDRCCISINAVCNLDCPYCHFGSKKNNTQSSQLTFSQSELEDIIRNIELYIEKNKHHIFKIGIVGSGEPMISFEAIRFIVERVSNSDYSNVFKLYTITNGTIMSNEQLDFFYKHRNIIDVNFSLDGYEELHNEFRSDFTATFSNIIKYENIFGEKPIINAVVTKKSLNNDINMLSFFKDSGFNRVNFSMVFGVEETNIGISLKEYEDFLIKASEFGISSRQNMTHEKKYDCTKYGRLCGVGRNNVFITKAGIYPCARFMGNFTYMIGDYNSTFFEIERNNARFIPADDGKCFYETQGVHR